MQIKSIQTPDSVKVGMHQMHGIITAGDNIRLEWDSELRGVRVLQAGSPEIHLVPLESIKCMVYVPDDAPKVDSDMAAVMKPVAETVKEFIEESMSPKSEPRHDKLRKLKGKK